MDKLLTYDNIAVAVLVAWVIELKFQVRGAAKKLQAEEKKNDKLMAVLLQMKAPIAKVCKVLKMKVDPNDDTGEFDLSEEG